MSPGALLGHGFLAPVLQREQMGFPEGTPVQKPHPLHSAKVSKGLCRGSRRRLLFSLMVGRHFFLRIPVGQRVGSMWGRWKEHAHRLV